MVVQAITGQAIRGLQVLLAGLLNVSAGAPAPPPDEIGVDQIGSTGAAAADTAQIQIKQPQADNVGLDQLPETLQPGRDAAESKLEQGITPARTLTAEVISAWALIRERGQTPTPDLIAREIGPDKLAEFLASNPAAGNILATGAEAGTPPADPTPEAGDGVIVLPPGSG